MSKILTNPGGNIILELKDDRLSAWLTIKRENRLIDEKDILDLVEQAGIKNGFEEAQRYMRKHSMEKDFDIPFPLAMCSRVQGESKLNYYFNLDQAKHRQKEIHLNDLPNLTRIEEGTVIADYNNDIFDRQGSIYDIYGDMLSDEELDVQAAEQIAGENVTFDIYHQQYLAECAGIPRVDEDGKISILDKVILVEDISYPAEVIRSPISMEVVGDIIGAQIAVAGNLIVKNNVIDCNISCQGDIQVQGDIQNCKLPGLEIKGDVQCKKIVSSKLLCYGKLVFSEVIKDSEIIANNGIYGYSGWLQGGHTESGGNIELQHLGDPEGKLTELEISISPWHKAALMRLTRRMIQLKNNPLSNIGEIEALNERIASCESELNDALNEFLQRPPELKFRILVTQDVYPPVNLRILKNEYVIKNKQPKLEIIEID
ncbi:MAG: FapA family protein [Candidatus Cloacimonadaceae bacterium]|jgi:uncharacterized protein (DUF342 family)|nr:FapA family protein [Candidatus Syntrophosphaera sp.]